LLRTLQPLLCQLWLLTCNPPPAAELGHACFIALLLLLLLLLLLVHPTSAILCHMITPVHA
jgi:hypothetical protein